MLLLVSSVIGCADRSSGGIHCYGLYGPGLVARLSREDAQARRSNDCSERETDEVARRFLTGPRRPWDVHDRTSAYSWFSVGRVYRVRDLNLNRRLVVGVLGDGTAPVCLTGPENRKATGEFLSKQFNGRFPDISKVDGVAKLLKDVTLGLNGVIANEQFLRSQERDDGLRGWLKGRERDPKVFKGLCTGVEARVDKNEWQLRFNVFNTQGGVDRLTASGTTSPLTIQTVSVEEIKRSGEFYFPLEGS